MIASVHTWGAWGGGRGRPRHNLFAVSVVLRMIVTDQSYLGLSGAAPEKSAMASKSTFRLRFKHPG